MNPIYTTLILVGLFAPLFFTVDVSAEVSSQNHTEKKTKHAQHRTLNDDVRHRGIEVLDPIYETTPVVRHQMALAFEFYQDMTQALYLENASEADKAAQDMALAVLEVPTEDLRDHGLEAWHQHAKLYERVLKEFRHESTISAKRSYFAHISEIVYCTVKSFGLGATLSNVYFCPMALDGKGAFWLTESNNVQNPYFGETMENCVELSETLGP